MDKNECQEKLDACGPPESYLHYKQLCINTQGSYSCDCSKLTGYIDDPSSPGKCIDFNECSSEKDNTCDWSSEKCVNIPGSYKCECKSGWQRDSLSGKCLWPTYDVISGKY